MGYSAMAQWDGVYGPLSGHCLRRERKASLLSLSFSLFPSTYLSLLLSLSISNAHASNLHYFIIFKHVTFLARLFFVSLSLFLGVAERRCKKKKIKKHVRNRTIGATSPLRHY